MPVISHALKTSLLHRVAAAEPSLIPDPMELNDHQLSTRLTSFDSLHWYMKADRVLDPVSQLASRPSNEDALRPFPLRPNSTSVVSPPFYMKVIKEPEGGSIKRKQKCWNLDSTRRSVQTHRQKWMRERETEAENSGAP